MFFYSVFYSFNYNTFTANIRYRTFRNVFPFLVAYIFADSYASYRKQILKINLFDEYCYLRAQELMKQNEYLLDHPGKELVRQMSKGLFGGIRISRRLWLRTTDRPMITLSVITKILSLFFKILSIDTLTQLMGAHGHFWFNTQRYTYNLLYGSYFRLKHSILIKETKQYSTYFIHLFIFTHMHLMHHIISSTVWIKFPTILIFFILFMQ